MSGEQIGWAVGFAVLQTLGLGMMVMVMMVMVLVLVFLPEQELRLGKELTATTQPPNQPQA